MNSLPSSSYTIRGLSPQQIAALKTMPLQLSDDGTLPASGPHGNTLRSLRQYGLIRPGPRRLELTGLGARELAQIEEVEAEHGF